VPKQVEAIVIDQTVIESDSVKVANEKPIPEKTVDTAIETVSTPIISAPEDSDFPSPVSEAHPGQSRKAAWGSTESPSKSERQVADQFYVHEQNEPPTQDSEVDIIVSDEIDPVPVEYVVERTVEAEESRPVDDDQGPIRSFVAETLSENIADEAAEAVVRVAEVLSIEDTLIIKAFLETASAEEVLTLQELFVSIAPIVERLEVLIVSGMGEGTEAEQIEAVIIEWYQGVMRSMGQLIETEKALAFVEALKQSFLSPSQETKDMVDEGTHEFKLSFPGLQAAQSLGSQIEHELGRLTVRRVAPSLA
jgi:hypothetical protein